MLMLQALMYIEGNSRTIYINKSKFILKNINFLLEDADSLKISAFYLF